MPKFCADLVRRHGTGPVILCFWVATAWTNTPLPAQDPIASSVTTSDPAIALDRLKLVLQPLDKDELDVEAQAWVELLKSKAQQVTDLQLQAIGNPDDAAISASASQATTELRELLRRVAAVVDSWRDKGGDVEEVELYISAVAGVGSPFTGRDFRTWLGEWLRSPEGGLLWARRIGLFLFVLLISWIVSKIAATAFGHAIEKIEGLSSLLRRFLAKIFGRLVLAVGVVVAIAMLGVDVGPLMAAIGAGGFIVAFALQNTLSNFASGLMILVYRPFDVGDFVNVAGVGGSVREMSLVSTTLATPDNQIVVIPNNSVWGGIITNVTGADQRRIDLVFGVGYDEDIKKVQMILREIVNANEDVLKQPEPSVEVHELADSSVNFICRPWVNTADYWKVYWELMRAVKERFDAEGITIPYPQQDVHMYTASP